MQRLSGALCATLALALAQPAAAVTIDLTLDADPDSSPSQLTYTIGLAESGTGNPLSINGYSLGIEFDAVELSFVSAQQLVSFGSLGVTSFLGPNDCSNGVCTAGNVPTEDSPPVGSLFSVRFDVLTTIDDGQVDFRAGILDVSTQDVTQATGQPPFDNGDVIVTSSVPVPEPSGLALLGVGGLLLALQRRLSFTLSR
jgi:hypothetical protein